MHKHGVVGFLLERRQVPSSSKIVIILFKELFIFILMYVCLPERMSVHCIHAWCLEGTEEGKGSSGDRATDSCEPL